MLRKPRGHEKAAEPRGQVLHPRSRGVRSCIAVFEMPYTVSRCSRSICSPWPRAGVSMVPKVRSRAVRRTAGSTRWEPSAFWRLVARNRSASAGVPPLHPGVGDGNGVIGVSVLARPRVAVIGPARSTTGVQGQRPCGGWPFAGASAPDRWGLPSVRPGEVPDHAGLDLGRPRGVSPRPWRALRWLRLARSRSPSRVNLSRQTRLTTEPVCPNLRQKVRFAPSRPRPCIYFNLCGLPSVVRHQWVVRRAVSCQTLRPGGPHAGSIGDNRTSLRGVRGHAEGEGEGSPYGDISDRTMGWRAYIPILVRISY